MTCTVPSFADSLTLLRYLADHVTPAIEVASRHRLRSANWHRLIVPRCRLNTYGRRAFPVAGPMVWNPLPDELRDTACDVDSFKQFFKTILLTLTSVTSALEVIFNVMRSINPRFTYLLNYLRRENCCCRELETLHAWVWQSVTQTSQSRASTSDRHCPQTDSLCNWTQTSFYAAYYTPVVLCPVIKGMSGDR